MVSVGLRGVFYEGKKQSVSLIQLSKAALSISPKGPNSLDLIPFPICSYLKIVVGWVIAVTV